MAICLQVENMRTKHDRERWKSTVLLGKAYDFVIKFWKKFLYPASVYCGMLNGIFWLLHSMHRRSVFVLCVLNWEKSGLYAKTKHHLASSVYEDSAILKHPLVMVYSRAKYDHGTVLAHMPKTYLFSSCGQALHFIAHQTSDEVLKHIYITNNPQIVSLHRVASQVQNLKGI